MEWSKTLNAFWMGAGDCEFIAWKGSHDVYVYPCDKYPQPPAQVIRHIERIETLEEFDNALNNGVWYDATYVRYTEAKSEGTSEVAVLKSEEER